MVGAFGMAANVGVDMLIGGGGFARLNLTALISGESGLGENFACEVHAGSKFLPVVGVGHIIELDDRRIAGIGGAQAHIPARLSTHGPDVNLEAVGRRRGLTIVAHRYWKKVILHIGILHSGTGANEGTGFEMVGGSEPALEQQPFESNAAFR